MPPKEPISWSDPNALIDYLMSDNRKNKFLFTYRSVIVAFLLLQMAGLVDIKRGMSALVALPALVDKVGEIDQRLIKIEAKVK